jgi:hypothetical protein
MKRLFGASLTLALAAAILPAQAADLPEVKITNTNQVPACATPGRLMAYLRTRNSKADARFESVATEYMRHGEELGIRWDIAFFQMVLETGALSFTGDVRATQNNFAGLGASGGGAHGEAFADISSGVKAHLQHLLMYAGDHIDNPVAERTRKVQEWGVLTEWQKSITGPMTFTLVAKQWAPTSRNYVRDLSTITSDFYAKTCNGPDPHPEYVQEARAGREGKPATQVADVTPQTAPAAAPDAAAPVADTDAASTPPPKVSGKDIARARIEEERKENAPIKALGAAGMLGDVANAAKAASEQKEAKVAQAPKEPPGEVTILNPSTKAKSEPAKSEPSKPDAAKGAQIQTASVAGSATQLKTPAASKSGKCKVWTASYGGQRAIIIKAVADGTTNYTVLDVNDPNESREVDAYIAAYAKGGEKVATFPSQAKALDKAFELCPEG